MPDELHVEEHGGNVLLDGPGALGHVFVVLSPAVALELAARLKSVATSIQPPPPEPCPECHGRRVTESLPHRPACLACGGTGLAIADPRGHP